MKLKLLIGFILGLSFSITTFAVPQTLTAKGGEVDILAIGRPSFIKIKGTGAAPVGKISIEENKVNGTFEFDVASLDTGIAMRNEHMKNKYLEVQKYPKALLVISALGLSHPWSAKNPSISDSDFEGTLTLHGITKPVKGRFTMGEDRNVKAAFNIKLTDFQVEIPAFAGVTLKDDVAVEVKINQMNSL